jgi:hypothetical protein
MEGFFMNEKYGFVYIWRDKKHNRYYIGCHWGAEEDGYICSSSWMTQAYKHRPQDFRRRILKRGLSRTDMYLEEQRYFSMIKPSEIKIRYYNLNLKSWELWHSDPNSMLTIGEKISKAKKGKKVRPCTPERAKKISDAKKGKIPNWSEEGKTRRKKVMAKPLSEEHKENISISLSKYYQENEHNRKGSTLSEEHRVAISKKLTGIKREYVMTEARETALKKRLENATKAKLGSKAYNNGEIEIRCKEHPGEGWILGGLKRQKSKNL